MNKLRTVVLLVAVLASPFGHCAGYSNWAVPTTIETIYGGTSAATLGPGVVISGAFGDPNSCGVANSVFVAQSNTSYKEIVAMSLAAISAGREMAFYSNACVQVPFRWGYVNVINLSLEGGGPQIR